MQSGKTFTANYLVRQWGYRLHKFAAPLKDMLVPLFDALGLNPTDCLEGKLKEQPLAELGGHSPRRVIQTLGTEWGRHTIDESLWVRIALNRILMDNKYGGWPIVVDDLRLPNEYDALAALPNCTLVKIVRPGEKPYQTHGSEGLLEDRQFDYTIINNDTPDTLFRMVDSVRLLGRERGARSLNQKEVLIEP
jgi:hypothetical protein